MAPFLLFENHQIQDIQYFYLNLEATILQMFPQKN